MKNKRNIGLVLTIVGGLFLVFGLSYAFYNYVITGDQNTVLVTGDIYMNYTENNQINLTDAVPMTKDDALKLNDNIFNFTISGKNQSSKDIYYGISIVYGEEQSSKTRLKDEDIDVYLTSGEDVLVNSNRYKSLNDTRIWVEKINAGTNSYTKDYSLRLWIDESVTIGNQDVDYTNEVWNNSYASFKVKVDGNLNEMNIPLSVDNKDTYYEHGDEYILVNISNYLNPHEAGLSLASNDIMKLEITSSNPDLMFTYSDSEEGSSSEKKNNLDLTYSFNENKVISIKVFPTSNSYSKIDTDISIKLTKNDKETYEMLKRIHIDEITSTCIKKGYNNLSDCLLITEQMGASDVNEAKEAIKAKGEADITKTSEQANENGMYKTIDNDGDTYFYRGDVKNNNVKFAGFYWKIVRINGDGSIRLIYNGPKSNSTGMEASSVTGVGVAYNTRYADPAYFGYMYGDSFSKEPKKTNEISYMDIAEKTEYYFADSYTTNSENRTFKLSGNMIKSTVANWTSTASDKKYTCMEENQNMECEYLIEIVSVKDATTVRSYIYLYGSTSYEGTRENTVSSNAKIVLEDWYTKNIENKYESGSKATNYVSLSGTFCNDRTLSQKEGNGNGVDPYPETQYASWKRIFTDKKPSLICPDVEHDLFSAKGSEGKGNKKLEKPIGLITADELNFAGPSGSQGTTHFYLYNGVSEHTMTPTLFHPQKMYTFMFYHQLDEEGGSLGYNPVLFKYALRGVINLNSNVLVKNGTGTIDDPYIVKLSN